MNITTERFDLPRGQKVVVTLLAGVMFVVAAVGAWFAVNGTPGSTTPAGDHIGFLVMTGMSMLIGALIALAARQAWRAAITLRDGGVELERGDDTPSFIGWGQIGGLKLRSAQGGTAVLDLGGDRLFSVDSRLVGVGRLLHAILVNAVLPKRSPILPYRAEQSIPRIVPIAIIMMLGFGATVMVASAPAAARQAVVLSIGAVVAVVGIVGALAARFGSARAVTVDRTGITFGHAGIRRPWSEVQGASLAFVRGPKGERFPRVALQAMDGRWEPINLPGADLVELLAAINAAAPGKVIPPPNQPIGLTNRLAFTFNKSATVRIGPPKK